MLNKIISLMLVMCMLLAVCVSVSAEPVGIEPAKPSAEETAPITIESVTCVGRTVTVKYAIDASENFDTSKYVTVLFYSPVGPEGEEKYITYNDGTKEHSAIYYADQVKYDNTDRLVFSIPSSVEEGTNYNVLVGGSDINYPGLYEGVEVPEGYMLGDVNNDTKIRTNDATAVLEHCAGIKVLEEGSYPALAADVAADGKIRTNDATKILRYCAGIISSFESNN